LINKARNSDFNVIGEFNANATTMKMIQTITKNVLSQNYVISQCHRNESEVEVMDWCFREIAVRITQKIEIDLKGNWTVTVGKYNKCLTIRNFNRNSNYMLQLGEIIFQIINYK